jgi:hypothetical protein
MTFDTVMRNVWRFRTMDAATACWSRKQGRMIVLGDDGRYWVASNRYALWLINRGYESVL